MVFLHGYVMLYPNFENWASLSTNHLEVGVHVKGDASDKEFAKKRTQFDLPLLALPMTPPDSVARDATTSPSLLDLPDENMPDWEALPVLDLWGQLSSEEEIVHRGLERYHQLTRHCEMGSQGSGVHPLCSDIIDEDEEETSLAHDPMEEG